jgi:hypothetical protein
MYLEELRQRSDYKKEELKEFERILRIINRRFAKV